MARGEQRPHLVALMSDQQCQRRGERASLPVVEVREQPAAIGLQDEGGVDGKAGRRGCVALRLQRSPSRCLRAYQSNPAPIASSSTNHEGRRARSMTNASTMAPAPREEGRKRGPISPREIRHGVDLEAAPSARSALPTVIRAGGCRHGIEVGTVHGPGILHSARNTFTFTSAERSAPQAPRMVSDVGHRLARLFGRAPVDELRIGPGGTQRAGHVDRVARNHGVAEGREPRESSGTTTLRTLAWLRCISVRCGLRPARSRAPRGGIAPASRRVDRSGARAAGIGRRGDGAVRQRPAAA